MGGGEDVNTPGLESFGGPTERNALLVTAVIALLIHKGLISEDELATATEQIVAEYKKREASSDQA